jgi:prepilin-type N-terminal cleavage/methylation domain-containing protein
MAPPGLILSMVPRTHRSAGFSLVEALIALAIAAMLAAVLTRLIGNTRANAGKIRELVEMMTVSDSLLEQTSPRVPGTMNGRTARFAWRVVVAPVAFSAVARRVNVKAPATADQNRANAPGLPPISDSAPGKPTSKPEQVAKWMPFRVTVFVESPSGRKYAADTISLGPPPANE